MNKNYCAIFLIMLTANLFSQTPDQSGKWFIADDSVKIYYEEAGAGKPVILVHGFVSNSQSWKRTELYNELQHQGFKVITPDLRGNGKSDKPHTEKSYENDVEAKDIMKLADILGYKNYAVIGYSRGAIIASRLLVLDKRVNQTVLGGMGADFMNPKWPRRIMFYEGLAGKKQIPEVAGLIEHIRNTPGLDQQALALMQYGQPFTSKEEFSKVKSPVLVICGTEDEDNGSSKALADLIPGSTYVRVPGIHNNANVSKEFSSEVITFLKK
jgi:pimeloyl-ACP methyl ester carboxylesterase